GVAFSGVAKGAQLMSVLVFSQIIDSSSCPNGVTPCAGAFVSDIIAAMEYVYTAAPSYNIASVNMSLGGGSFTAPCDNQPYKPAIDNLRSIGIATVVAAGNDAAPNALAAPSCVSSAVSGGSTNKSGQVSWFSDIAPFLSLLAPGESITSSIPGGGFEAFDGTSMAAPHVAGAWGVLKQAAPASSVDQIISALQHTGLPITDTRLWATGTV